MINNPELNKLNNMDNLYQDLFISLDNPMRAYQTPAYPGGGYVPVNLGYMGSWEEFKFEDSHILYQLQCMNNYEKNLKDNIRVLEKELSDLNWAQAKANGFDPLELIYGIGFYSDPIESSAADADAVNAIVTY